MSNKVLNILIFSTLAIVVGAVVYSQTKGISQDIKKNW